jgi:hypothetical protein
MAWTSDKAGPGTDVEPALQEAEAGLGLGCGCVTRMAGLDGGHGWDYRRYAMRDRDKSVDQHKRG